MKKHLFTILVILCAALFLTVSAVASEPIAEGTEPFAWSITEDGTLTITGSGSMPNYSKNAPAPWYPWAESVTNVVITGEVQNIGDTAFCQFSKMTTISLPASIISIGLGAFSGCRSLTQIIIPEGVTEIAPVAFLYCESLEEAQLPSTLVSLGTRSFGSCRKLSRVSLPEGLTYLGHTVFENCDSLTSIYIPGTITSDFRSAFEQCDALETVTFGEGLKLIGEMAFAFCPSLTSVSLPSTLEQVNSRAFAETGIQTVEMSANVTYLAPGVFEATKLTDIYFYGTAAQWKRIYKGEYSIPRNVDIHYMGNACRHLETTVQTGTAATCLEAGMSEGRICAGCGKVLAEQSVLPALGHKYEDGVCTRCGAEESPARLLGDADGDGALSYNDALVVLRYSINIGELDADAIAVADVDGLPGISYNDALTILRASIGLETLA